MKKKPPSLVDRLTEMRRLFVQGASWDSDGNLTGVTFFPPTMIMATRQAEMAEQVTGNTLPGTGDDAWDETPEMKRLRTLAEDDKTSGEAAEHYLSQYRKLAAARMSYYSS